MSENIPHSKTIKILAIGNSFSQDAVEHLGGLYVSAGYQNVTIANMYIGGCSLDTHWTNIVGDIALYDYELHRSVTDSMGKVSMLETQTTSNTKLSTAIVAEDWDFVTIQQVSGLSGVSSSYSNLNNILNWILQNKTNDNAKIYWQMTWAYQGDSDHPDFTNYSNDQIAMYDAIVSVNKEKILTNDKIDGVIPSGTAVQNLRTSSLGDTLTRDGFHLSYDVGRFVASLTWFAALTNLDVNNFRCDYLPDGVLNINLLKTAVKNALNCPFTITQFDAKNSK